jgi:hypothetical protein
MKLWSFKKIKEALEDVENQVAYYVGGSLCIDFEDHPCVVLNKNGRGFFYNFKNSSHKQIKFVADESIKIKVNEIYSKYKK